MSEPLISTYTISLQVRGSSGAIGIRYCDNSKLLCTPSEEKDRVDKKNLRSIPAEDRSGGRRLDCPTATSIERGEAAGNWSPASTFVCVRLEQETPTNLRDVEEGADLDPA